MGKQPFPYRSGDGGSQTGLWHRPVRWRLLRAHQSNNQRPSIVLTTRNFSPLKACSRVQAALALECSVLSVGKKVKVTFLIHRRHRQRANQFVGAAGRIDDGQCPLCYWTNIDIVVDSAHSDMTCP